MNNMAASSKKWRDLNDRRSEENDHFYSINEHQVDDISLEYFYKPHTVSLLAISVITLLYIAFTRDDSSLEDNIYGGLCCVVFAFLVISVLTFPNGPFTRPHPAVWRIVFGLSVLYLLGLLLILFQNYDTVKTVMYWFYPELKHFHIDMEKEYGVNCSDITVERIWHHVDVFASGHFFGWMMKAMLVRHVGICWTISVMWEITEVAFAHLLPNFVECWWDALLLDIILCNGLGIFCGMFICNKLEMRAYNWESIKDIQSTTGKIRRAVLQFTPSSWTHVRWLDPTCSYMRFLAICELVIMWQISELNTFFLKHIFEIPPSHPLCVGRIILVGVIVAPSLRQFYVYVTDTRCKRVGTQCWVFGAITMAEALICIKFGSELFAQTEIVNIIIWLIIQFVLSVFCVYFCVLWAKRSKEFQCQSDGVWSNVPADEDGQLSSPTSPTVKTVDLDNNLKRRRRKESLNGFID
ncbi:hypothetical protein CHUAL_001064 [Chamberlinius hualienensis]